MNKSTSMTGGFAKKYKKYVHDRRKVKSTSLTGESKKYVYDRRKEKSTFTTGERSLYESKIKKYVYGRRI